MQQVDRLKFLPPHFTEDDKINYEILCDDAKRIFKNIKDDWLIHLSVIAHINEEKGLKQESSHEQIAEIMDRYDLSKDNLVLKTPYDETFDMQATMKEIIEAEVQPVVTTCEEE